jgi:hypothetical protein
MKNMKTIFAAAILFTAILSTSSCKKDTDGDLTGTGPVTIEFDNRFGDGPLTFGTTYTNQNGEEVTLSMFNYYVSNFVLVKEDGTEYIVPKDECYHLVRHDVSSTHSLTINNVPAGEYHEVKFLIGVDSLKSASDVSARTGALDVATNGDMYWMWNSGYIFMKMEGMSDTTSFKYHIGLYGGYATPTINNIKSVTLDAHDEMIMVGKDRAPEVHVYTDAKEVFGSPNPLIIANTPVIMVNPASANVAANYADMFKLDHVHND